MPTGCAETRQAGQPFRQRQNPGPGACSYTCRYVSSVGLAYCTQSWLKRTQAKGKEISNKELRTSASNRVLNSSSQSSPIPPHIHEPHRTDPTPYTWCTIASLSLTGRHSGGQAWGSNSHLERACRSRSRSQVCGGHNRGGGGKEGKLVVLIGRG